MDVLKALIDQLSKEEVKSYKLIANRTRNHKERKDLNLFNYYRKNDGHANDEEIFNKLFPNNASKNPFYRLKNKVVADINKSLLFLNTEKDPEQKVIKNYGLARLFTERYHYQLAYRYLIKAEKQALNFEKYGILDLIYGELIQLGGESLDVDPESYIIKRNYNRKKLDQLREIDELLALVKNRIHRTYNRTSKSPEISGMLQKTIDKFSQQYDLVNTPSFRFKIYHAVSNMLLQNNEFQALAEYIENTYNAFSSEGLFNKQNHDTKLKMISYLVNANFKIGNHDESLKYGALLKREMKRYHCLYYNKYLIFYYNALFINYSQIAPQKAIDLLENLKGDEKVKQLSHYPVFVLLNLALMYYETGKNKLAIKQLNELYQDASYPKLDEYLRFKIRLNELMIRHKIRDLDILEKRIHHLKKDFPHVLAGQDYQREATLIKLLEQMSCSLYWKNNQELVDEIEAFREAEKNADTSNDLINYEEWLASYF